jgi:hypothetical protein
MSQPRISPPPRMDGAETCRFPVWHQLRPVKSACSRNVPLPSCSDKEVMSRGDRPRVIDPHSTPWRSDQ